jgi:hypothetical protein
MPIPDSLPFFRANQTTLYCGRGKEFSKSQSLALLFREVASGARFT